MRSDAPVDELLNALPDIITAVSADGRVLMCSPAIEAVTDYRPEELIGRRLLELPLLDAEGLAIVAAEMHKVLSGSRTPAVVLPVRHRDGSRRWLEARSAAVRSEDGATVVRTILRDTTDRVVAEQRLRAIVDHTNDIIIILDGNGVISFENPAVTRILGFDPGERLGHSIFEYVHPDDRAAAADIFATMTAPDATGALTARFSHKNGSWRYLETHGRNMLHVTAINGVLGVGRDVTERMRLQERLDAAERLDSIGRLAGGIAHDFNNLLTVIMASTEQLRQRPMVEDSDRDLGVIAEAAERARELTAKLLTSARRQPVEPGMVDASASALAAEGFLRRLLGEGCGLSVTGFQTPLTVPVSPAQFEQILLNLAANGRDAMPDGGRFAIDASVLDTEAVRATGLDVTGTGPILRVACTDTGVGMPDEVVERVFEPFYTTKEHGKGTGLGLSMVYGIVRSAGGDLRITSRPGSGTAVEVFLPLLGREPVRPRIAPPAVVRGGSETILVVEDNEDVRRVTTRALRQMGYEVLESDCGGHALDRLMAGTVVSLVVTDVIMPEMTGVSMVQEIRRHWPTLPVLFITGYTPEQVLERQPLDARTTLLTKPFKREVLLDRVRTMLDIGPA